jgi:hypothetical protein
MKMFFKALFLICALTGLFFALKGLIALTKGSAVIADNYHLTALLFFIAAAFFGYLAYQKKK